MTQHTTDIETPSARAAMVAKFEAGTPTLAEQMAAVERAAGSRSWEARFLNASTLKKGLIAEAEVLAAAQATLARVPELEAEIARLTVQCVEALAAANRQLGYKQNASAQLATAQAEARRLREALQTIANMCNAPHWNPERRWKIRDMAEKETRA